MCFSLSSSAFNQNAPIPQHYTAEGADVSPPLSWQSSPVGTQSLVLIVDDPDAPDPTIMQLDQVMQGRVLGEVILMGTYRKH